MAYETGSAVDLEDLIAKISTFATANGWTEDRRDNATGIFGLSKNSMFMSNRWDPASPSVLSVHQATAALPGSGTEPGNATGDSGNGYNTTSAHTNSLLDDERHVVLGDGPFPSYYLFEQDASPAYLHIVVETSTGVFAHFGIGELNKVGDGWTGGEYCYGQVHSSSTALNSASSWLLDGYAQSTTFDNERQVATIRISGFSGQIVGSVWGNVWGSRTQLNQPTDSAGNSKVFVQGGFRAGPFASWGLFSGSKTTGMVPMYSISAFYVDNTSNHAYLLGWMPDVRGVNIRSFAEKDEVLIGSDTWVLFPARQRDIGGGAQTTGFMGIAYKKVTA